MGAARTLAATAVLPPLTLAAAALLGHSGAATARTLAATAVLPLLTLAAAALLAHWLPRRCHHHRYRRHHRRRRLLLVQARAKKHIAGCAYDDAARTEAGEGACVCES